MSLPLVPVAVTGRGLPAVTWPCRRCDRRVAHRCTGRFRVNANGRLLDVWLLYLCVRCGATRKLEVFARVPVGSVDVDRLDAADYARDAALLRRAGAGVQPDEFTVDRTCLDGPAHIELRFVAPLLVRLDDVLGAALGASRSDIGRRITCGAIAGVDRRTVRSLRLWAGAAIEVVSSRPST